MASGGRWWNQGGGGPKFQCKHFEGEATFECNLFKKDPLSTPFNNKISLLTWPSDTY